MPKAQPEKLNLFKELKHEYVQPKKPTLIEVGPASYLAVDGRGGPGGEVFQERIGALYAMAYTLKFQSKDAGRDYVVGKLEALYVVGDKLHLPNDALKKAGALNLLVIQASHPHPLLTAATALLPAAMWAEADGTIVNAAGKFARMYAAVEPAGYARPHWQALVQVARKAGMTLDFTTAKDVNLAMKGELDFFSAADWGPPRAARLLRYAGSRG